jgi:hypothetical protein
MAPYWLTLTASVVRLVRPAGSYFSPERGNRGHVGPRRQCTVHCQHVFTRILNILARGLATALVASPVALRMNASMLRRISLSQLPTAACAAVSQRATAWLGGLSTCHFGATMYSLTNRHHVGHWLPSQSVRTRYPSKVLGPKPYVRGVVEAIVGAPTPLHPIATRGARPIRRVAGGAA